MDSIKNIIKNKNNMDDKKLHFINRPLDVRIRDCELIKNKYPTRLPIIITKHKNSTLPMLDKYKFLVPNNITVGEFLYIIRKRITLKHDEAMFFFTNNSLPCSSETILNLYNKHKDIDGYLYIEYTNENTFG